MAIDIIMPKLGLTMSEGTIIKWHKSEGDYVEKGDVILELESDKSINEEVAKHSGYLLKTYYDEGDVVPILTRIAVLGEKDEQIEEQIEGQIEEQSREAVAVQAKQDTQTSTAVPAAPGNARVIASPLARKTAKLLGVDLSAVVAASGKRIVAKDVYDFSDNHTVLPTAPRRAQKAPMSRMRKTIAARMHNSLQTNAQTTQRTIVDMTEAAKLRDQFKESGSIVSYNAIVAYITCKALMEYPVLNSELADDCIMEKTYVNLGIAVALDAGLIVPVLRDADRMSLTEISTAIREKSQAAREGKLSLDDCTGGSFTISNLGMYGLDEFVAIINPPEAGILAVGAVREAPVAVDGGLYVRQVMTLTLSYDHRIVDGAPAAQFLMRVKELLERPNLLL